MFYWPWPGDTDWNRSHCFDKLVFDFDNIYRIKIVLKYRCNNYLMIRKISLKNIYHLKYAIELGIGDDESLASSYLFTSNLKELSGALLHKTVFAFLCRIDRGTFCWSLWTQCKTPLILIRRINGVCVYQSSILVPLWKVDTNWLLWKSRHSQWRMITVRKIIEYTV